MFKQLKTIAAAATLAAFGLTAQANTISAAVSVDAGAVEYWAFDYAFDLLPFGSINTFTVGATAAFTEDPHLCVFRGSVAAGNLVGCDDDSGPGFNASLTFNNPIFSSGTYIIALSGFELTSAEALAGTNPGSSAFATTLTVTSAFLNPVIRDLRQVPEPGTLVLAGLALAGLGLRRKQAK